MGRLQEMNISCREKEREGNKMEKKPKIIVAGMCDTKFTELKFLADEVAKAGGDVKILNCG